MNVKDFYGFIGGSYEEVAARLMKEERILKYLNKFTAAEDHANLHKFLEEKNYPEAFRAVHSLKGVALNLGLAPLFKVSDVLCEELRSGEEPKIDISGMVSDVDAAYRQTLDAIALIDQ